MSDDIQFKLGLLHQALARFFYDPDKYPLTDADLAMIPVEADSEIDRLRAELSTLAPTRDGEDGSSLPKTAAPQVQDGETKAPKPGGLAARLRADAQATEGVSPSAIEQFLVRKSKECLATVKYAEDNADDWAGALPAADRDRLRHDAQQYQYAADCIATLVIALGKAREPDTRGEANPSLSSTAPTRDEVIEECAKIADGHCENRNADYRDAITMEVKDRIAALAREAHSIAVEIRALSSTLAAPGDGSSLAITRGPQVQDGARSDEWRNGVEAAAQRVEIAQHVYRDLANDGRYHSRSDALSKEDALRRAVLSIRGLSQ